MTASNKKNLHQRVIGFLKRKLFGRKIVRDNFVGSKTYWEDRYKANQSSGAGSYGRLAEFKAEFLNQFVIENAIDEVTELGCGDGNQLSLATYKNYIGIDVSQKAIQICRERFNNDNTKSFFLIEPGLDYSALKAELVLSLDVLYHLIEDDVFEDYIKKLFELSTKYVIIYSSNFNKEIDVHVKSRKFSEWISDNVSQHWKLSRHVQNKYPYQSNNRNNTSMSDFYVYKKIE